MQKIVYTAAFSQPSHHKGSVFSAALNAPENYKGNHAPLFYPTPKLLFFWKTRIKQYQANSLSLADMHGAWKTYESHYTAILDERKELINDWLDSQENAITLLCYESGSNSFPYDVCHRNVAGQWIEAHFDFIHVADSAKIYTSVSEKGANARVKVRKGKSFSTLEEGLQILETMGIKAIAIPLECDPDFFQFTYFTNHSNEPHQMGLWTRTGLLGVISQMIHPQLPDKWLSSCGLPNHEDIKLLKKNRAA
jgi:hypothetical protein